LGKKTPDPFISQLGVRANWEKDSRPLYFSFISPRGKMFSQCGAATLDRSVGGTGLANGDWRFSNYGHDGTNAKVNTNRYGEDLHISTIDSRLIDSANDTHHAQRKDIGKTLRIHSGTDFTPGDYQIVDVVITRDSNGTITSSAWQLDPLGPSAGTGGASGGVFSILDEKVFYNATINEVVELADYAAAGVDAR
jgi:subtilase family serine protease